MLGIFQDNKHSSVVTLEDEFSNTKMENFPTALAYRQRLKSLADQLKNVGTPVPESRLVIQLVSGLTSADGSVRARQRRCKEH